MKKLLFLCLAISLSTMAFAADDDNDSKAVDRIKAASDVLNEIEGAPDQGIPEEVLGSAECVAVVPSMLKGRLHRGGPLRARRSQLPHVQGLERSGVHCHRGREFWPADWRAGGRPGDAHHESRTV